MLTGQTSIAAFNSAAFKQSIGISKYFYLFFVNWNIFCLQVVFNILEKLKQKDKLFSKMSAGLYYTGSFYDGVRVAEASEFDLNVVLKFPMCADNVKVGLIKVI